MGLHRNAELQMCGIKVPQTKHDLRQGGYIVLLPLTVINQHMGLYRNAEFTYWVFQNAQSESLWHLIKNWNKSKSHYVFEITTNELM